MLAVVMIIIYQLVLLVIFSKAYMEF